MKNILVIGSSNVDFVQSVKHFPKPGETIISKKLEIFAGGKGANQAVAIVKLGGKVNFLSVIGNDENGKFILDNLKKSKVEVNSVNVLENEHSGVATITVNDSGENIIIVNQGANLKLNNEYIKSCIDIIKTSDIIVIQLEIPYKTIEYIIDLANEMDKVIILNPAPITISSNEDFNFFEKILKKVDILIPNETELNQISNMRTNSLEEATRVCKILIEKGVKNIYATLGSNGSIFVNKNEYIRFKPIKVNVIDTTAAGDSYVGAISVYLSKNKSFKEAGEFATKTSAITVTKKGAQFSIPTIDEVNSYKFV